MHRMHANRASVDGTGTALDNTAVQRIATGIEKAQSRRTAKHGSKKTASVQTVAEPVVEPALDTTIKVAGIHEIPKDFERIGTGFYRNGHHLWELAPTTEGFVLIRKKSEDHVLGFDPDPVSKSAIMDRNGNEIKLGSKVNLPHRGRVAGAVVIVLQPSSLGMELDSGERINAPPDICELAPMEEGMHAPGAEFEPDIEPSSKAAPAMVAEEAEEEAEEEIEEPGIPEEGETTEHEESETPEEEEEEHEEGGEEEDKPEPKKMAKVAGGTHHRRCTGCGKVFTSLTQENMCPTCKAQKTAQTNTTTQQLPKPSPAAPLTPDASPQGKKGPEFERAISPLIKKLDAKGFAVLQSNSMQSRFAAEKVGDGQYKVYAVIEKFQPLFGPVSADEVMKWEAQVPDLQVMDPDATTMKAAMRTISGIDLVSWRQYWEDVGERVAAARKPLSPEQRERRKQRRKERQQERKGLPPSASVPPRKTKSGVSNVDDAAAKMKERLRLYQQLVDEIEFVLQDESLRTDEVLLADEMERIITEHKEQLDEADEQSSMEMEDDLSIETPLEEVEEEEEAPVERVAQKVVVSMTEI
jgi:hypothetical protein